MAQSSDSVAPARSVLLTRFSAFGDVAMTVPVVYSACRCYPDVRFVMVTRPSMVSIFVDAPANLTVMGVDLKEKYAGIGGLHRLASELYSQFHPDTYIDLHNVLRTKVLAFLLRLRGVKVAALYKARAKRRSLTRMHNKVMLPLTSQRARYREAFFKGGFPLTERFDGLFSGRGTAPDERYAAISAPKAKGEKWVGVAPFAAHKGKIYPLDMMEKVIAYLDDESRRGALRVFLLGGGDKEAEILGQWAAKYPCATSLAGKKYGFGAELALFNHLDVMLSMDSANMHLAAIAGAPTVSIWGATHPYCGFKGWRQSEADIVQLPLACRPCSVFGDKECPRGDYLCLTGIKPETVFQRIKDHLL